MCWSMVLYIFLWNNMSGFIHSWIKRHFSLVWMRNSSFLRGLWFWSVVLFAWSYCSMPIGFLLYGRNQFPIALDKAHTPWSDVLVLSTGPLRYITQMSEENYVVMKTGLSTFLKNERLYFQRDWKPLFNVSPLVIEMCQKPCPLFWSAIVLVPECKNNKQLTF